MSEIFGKRRSEAEVAQARVIARAMRAEAPGTASRRAVLAAASAGALGTIAAPLGGLAPPTREDRFVIVDGWVLSEDDLAPPRRR